MKSIVMARSKLELPAAAFRLALHLRKLHTGQAKPSQASFAIESTTQMEVVSRRATNSKVHFRSSSPLAVCDMKTAPVISLMEADCRASAFVQCCPSLGDEQS